MDDPSVIAALGLIDTANATVKLFKARYGVDVPFTQVLDRLTGTTSLVQPASPAAPANETPAAPPADTHRPRQARAKDGKQPDPKRVAAGNKAWLTRKANEAKAPGDAAEQPAPQRGRRRKATAAKPEKPVDQDGLTRGQRAHQTRLTNFRALHPELTEAEAKHEMMSSATKGRQRKAKALKKTAASTRRTTRAAGRRQQTGRRAGGVATRAARAVAAGK